MEQERSLKMQKVKCFLLLCQPDTHAVVNKDVQFIFGIIQTQEPVEELWQEWSRLLDECTNSHLWKFLFR